MHGTETVSAEQFYECFKQQNAAPTNGHQTNLEDTGVIEEEAGHLDYCDDRFCPSKHKSGN